MANQAYRVAVVGVTGAVGQEILRVLERRKFPVSELVPLASERSAGAKTKFSGKDHLVRKLEASAFEGVDFAFFSAGATRSREFVPVAIKAGAVVIDNSSAFRMDPKVPLVVPEVNGALLEKTKPDCEPELFRRNFSGCFGCVASKSRFGKRGGSYVPVGQWSGCKGDGRTGSADEGLCPRKRA